MTGKEFAEKCVGAERIVKALREQAESTSGDVMIDPVAVVAIVAALADLIVTITTSEV